MFDSPDSIIPAYYGPTNFCWLAPGMLGGCPRPGIFKDMFRDLAALQRVKTRLLVTLTEEWAPDVDMIEKYEMDSLYVPITDLAAPTLQQASMICQKATQYIEQGKAVVFHCRAGKGRTGTLLAAMLIWAGQTSEAAISKTRHKNRQWIESDSQISFLEDFQGYRDRQSTDL